MERKNILIGVGISALAAALVGVYIYYNRETRQEDENVEEIKEEKIETIEDLYTQLNEEIKDMK